MRLRDLDTPPIGKVIGYASGAERVAAYRRLNSRIGSTAADHAPDIPVQHRPLGQLPRFADRRAEQRPLKRRFARPTRN